MLKLQLDEKPKGLHCTTDWEMIICLKSGHKYQIDRSEELNNDDLLLFHNYLTRNH